MSLMRDLLGMGQGQGLPGPLGNFFNLIQKFQQFSKNPLGSLLGIGVDIPKNVGNNPESMVNYLRNSGQMTEEQFEQISQLAHQFQSIIPRKP